MSATGTQILLVVTANKTEQERLAGILLPVRNSVFVDSASDAMSLLKSRLHPSLILLDADLPRDAAFELYAYLRSKIKYEDIPVLFMMSKDSAKEARCLSIGAADVVSWECPANVLIGRIDKIISARSVNDYLVSKITSYKDTLHEEHQRLKRYTRQVIRSLSKAIDAKDEYTNGHSLRVAEYSCMIAKKMGLNEQLCEIIYQSGLLHDIGKIGISDTVLRKPGGLNNAELEAIRNHPIIGYNILSSISEIPLVALAAKYHHERYDGTGYPEGLKGKEIPLIARIICVADSFDAMTSNRSYRTPLSPLMARDELVRCAGTQFDPDVVRVASGLIETMVSRGFVDKSGIAFTSVYMDGRAVTA